MRIRQVVAALIVLLGLSAQVRTAFACTMMPGQAQAQRCCPGLEGGAGVPGGVSTCCDAAAPGDTPLAQASSFKPHFLHADHPPVAGGPAPRLLAAASDPGDDRLRRPDPPSHPRAALPLYLLTARLRL